ncbi:MAG: hypothetical protein IPG47_04000 [Thermoflexaceae bacterium]|nr:hypothetical protein [Thermoflexaceae bacterium]
MRWYPAFFSSGRFPLVVAFRLLLARNLVVALLRDDVALIALGVLFLVLLLLLRRIIALDDVALGEGGVGEAGDVVRDGTVPGDVLQAEHVGRAQELGRVLRVADQLLIARLPERAPADAATGRVVMRGSGPLGGAKSGGTIGHWSSLGRWRRPGSLPDSLAIVVPAR